MVVAVKHNPSTTQLLSIHSRSVINKYACTHAAGHTSHTYNAIQSESSFPFVGSCSTSKNSVMPKPRFTTSSEPASTM